MKLPPLKTMKKGTVTPIVKLDDKNNLLTRELLKNNLVSRRNSMLTDSNRKPYELMMSRRSESLKNQSVEGSIQEVQDEYFFNGEIKISTGKETRQSRNTPVDQLLFPIQ